MKRYRKFEDILMPRLKDPAYAAQYLNEVADAEDPAALLLALSHVAKAHGMSAMAKTAGVQREGLYRSLSKNGNPELKTFWKLLKASGVRITFVPQPLMA
jgi:probable addiction module antidote protein